MTTRRWDIKALRQRKSTDCGIACVAMLANCFYSDAKRTLFPNGPGKNGYVTTKDQMRMALLQLGVITSRRLVRCGRDISLTRDALLATNYRSSDDEWHWAVWDSKRKKILDPYYKRTRPFSQLTVLRRYRMVRKSRKAA